MLDVWMTTELIVSTNDVLSGKVDPNSLDTMYVALSYPGMGHRALERLLEAVNYMAKFGWRLRGCLEQYCIMEKAGSA